MPLRIYEEDITLREPHQHDGTPAKFVAVQAPLDWYGCIYAHDALWKNWVTPLTNTNRLRPDAFDGADGEEDFLMYARLHAHFQHGILFDYKRGPVGGRT